jgi:hypothetical protein
MSNPPDFSLFCGAHVRTHVQKKKNLGTIQEDYSANQIFREVLDQN